MEVLNQFKPHSENAVFVVGTDNLEGPYFRGVGYVQADAETFVVIAYLDYPHRLRSPFGQSFQVEASRCFFLGDKFGRDGQVPCDDLVDGCFDVGYFFIGRGLWQGKVEFAFLAFDVRRHGMRFTMCSHVCIGGYSVLLCPLS